VVLYVLKAHQEELQTGQVLEMEEYGGSHEKSAAWGETGEQNDATMRMSYVVVEEGLLNLLGELLCRAETTACQN
jgi:hypothetical protein